MAEVGETSSAKPSGEIWAKLVPSDSRFPDVEIRDLVLTQDTLQSQDIGSDESLLTTASGAELQGTLISLLPPYKIRVQMHYLLMEL